MAAIEFALILPLMVTVYFGMVTFTNGYATRQRIESVARTTADLAGRLNGAVPLSEVAATIGASAALMAPYEPEGMEITLASVVVPSSGTGLQGKVCWSQTRRIDDGGVMTTIAAPADLAKGSMIDVPPGLRIQGNGYVVSLVRHTYKPAVGHAITGDIPFEDRVSWPTRAGAPVLLAGQTTC